MRVGPFHALKRLNLVDTALLSPSALTTLVTSNVFAIQSLRALYFALAGIMQLFRYLVVVSNDTTTRYLHYGLSAILVFVEITILMVDIYKIPVTLSLGVSALIRAVSVAASVMRPAKTKALSGGR